MMQISEIKKWAKSKGYDVIKEKDDSINGASYYWMKSDDHNISGVALSVSKLATAIFNSMTDNKWVEYQKEYQENKTYKNFSINDYGN
jgi:hypothetical protein